MARAGDALIHGPLSAGTAHLCVDMQKLFGPQGPWPTPWMERVLPVVAHLAERFAGRNVFTRFIPPVRAEDEVGAWRGFYRRWQAVTRERLPADMLELVPALARFVPPAPVVDRPRFSAFAAPRLGEVLGGWRVDTLVISGAETDMCVLASVLGAVDRGYRVILVEDAVCSSSDAGHDALMSLYRGRFAEQIETVTSAALLEAAGPVPVTSSGTST